MKQYEITMTLDNITEIVRTISAENEYKAINECRELIKKEYKTKHIWFTNLKKL